MTEEEKIRAMIEEEHKIIAGYMDIAKTFTQLSIGALVLSITFLKKYLALPSYKYEFAQMTSYLSVSTRYRANRPWGMSRLKIFRKFCSKTFPQLFN